MYIYISIEHLGASLAAVGGARGGGLVCGREVARAVDENLINVGLTLAKHPSWQCSGLGARSRVVRTTTSQKCEAVPRRDRI